MNLAAATAAIHADQLVNWEALVALSTVALTIATAAAVIVAVKQSRTDEHAHQDRLMAEEHRHQENQDAEENRHQERLAEIDAEAAKAATQAQEAMLELLRQAAAVVPPADTPAAKV